MIGRDCALDGKLASGLHQSLHLKPVRNSCLVPVIVYLRRCLSQIAEMRVNVALSNPDTTSRNLARSNVKLCKFELKHSSFRNAKNFLFVRTNTKITKLDTLDWNVNYSQLKARN